MNYPKNLIEKVEKRSEGMHLEGINEGAGPIDAEIMIVGEAPGREEIESHIPFHGASGQELMKSLALLGLKREDVYITSAVRSRPYGIKKVFSKRENKEVIKYPNRKPTKKEILAHAPFLDYEINIVKPKLIIAVGNTALERLLGKGHKISLEHGKEIENTKILKLNDQEDGYVGSEHTYTVVPMFHPAAVFYNRKLTDSIEQDWKNLAIFLKRKGLLAK